MPLRILARMSRLPERFVPGADYVMLTDCGEPSCYKQSMGNIGIFFFFSYTTDAIDEGGFGFEGDDAFGVAIVESKAENGEVGGELSMATIEEEILLQMGSSQRRSK